MEGPMMATTTKTARIPNPMRTLGEWGSRIARKRPPRAGASGPGRAAAPVPSLTPIAIASRLLPGTRVDEHVNDVGDEVGGQHHQRDHQEDPLGQRQVLVDDRLEEEVADPRVAEDDLHQQL